MKEIMTNPLLFCSILDYGKGSKMCKFAKDMGAVGSTIILGKGTVRNEWLNILGVVEIRKEIFIAIIDEQFEDTFFKTVSDKFSIEKRHHGIAFSTALKHLISSKDYKIESSAEKKGVNNMDFEAIFVVVNKDDLDDVLDAAEAAGSTGGTVIHGRGAGSKEKTTLFNIEIEPEKDIVLILSHTSKTDAIINSINDKLNLHKPNTGIIFVVDVRKTLGLYKGE
ncbi:MAG: P-II family nitrogen regulator [Tissierella sp.]|nr:P-II family nitrogen regulator [Tissierella sp.]